MAGTPLGLLPIELELIKERASALQWTGQKLEKLIARIRAVETELSALAGARRAEKLSLHAELRRQAEEERWKMIVQREAMGLRSHQVVDEIYPIPARIPE